MDKNSLIKRICLGTAQFGLDYGIANRTGKIQAEDVFEILDFAHAMGLDLLDTASSYGDSETVIGKCLKEKKLKFNVVSKISQASEINPSNASEQLKGSLRRLRMKRLFGYLIHSIDNIKRFPQLWVELEKFKKEGAVERIGFSLYHPADLEWLLQEGMDFDILQAPYSVLDQRFTPYLEDLRNKNIEFHARSVFLQGLLLLEARMLPDQLRRVEEKLKQLKELSLKIGISPQALCLHFVLLNPLIKRVVIGIDNLNQFKEHFDNLDSLDKTQEFYEQLSALAMDDEDVLLPYRWESTMKATAVIQARTGAQRLPKKVLLELKGKAVLDHVIERVKSSKTVDRIIVVTTDKKEDEPIVQLAKAKGTQVFCGSEKDVLDRFYQAATHYKLQHIIRITADCPVIDAQIIDQTVEKYFNENADYCSNTLTSTYPDGEDVEVFSYQALKKAWQKAKLQSEREHVTPYIWKNADQFNLTSIESKINYGHKRWTLDEKEDYEFLKKLYDGLYQQNHLFGMQEILNFLKENPDLEKINSMFARNQGYQQSVQNEKVSA